MTTFEERQRADGASRYRVIEIHGELGLPDVDELRARLETTTGGEEGIVIGLEHCEFIDSIALAALLRAHSRAAADDRPLVMAAPTAQLRRVLRAGRLETRGLFFDTVEEAMAGAAC
jgi:anti-anti-sigma factor